MTKLFGFIGTDHISAKIVINNETLYQVYHFNYLSCSISYLSSNGIESKLAKLLQLIGTFKRTMFKKLRKENIKK